MTGASIGPGGRYLIAPAAPSDAKHLVPRQCDIDEWNASITGGVANLGLCIAASDEAWALWDQQDATLLALFGVVTQGNSLPTTWLIGTDRCEHYGLALMSYCMGHVQRMFERWPLTECFSDARNTVHHRWLEWLGYQRRQELTMGPEGRLFYNYVKEPQPCA